MPPPDTRTRPAPLTPTSPDDASTTSTNVEADGTADRLLEALTDEDIDRAAEEFVRRHGAGYAGRVATALLCAGALAQHEEVTSC